MSETTSQPTSDTITRMGILSIMGVATGFSLTESLRIFGVSLYLRVAATIVVIALLVAIFSYAVYKGHL